MKKYCGNCANIKCRCDSCVALIEKDNKWYCEDYEMFCDEVEVCTGYEQHDWEEVNTGCWRNEVQ